MQETDRLKIAHTYNVHMKVFALHYDEIKKLAFKNAESQQNCKIKGKRLSIMFTSRS